MAEAVLLIPACVFLALFTQRFGSAVAIVVVLVGSLAIFPVVLTSTVRAPHVGVAGPGLDISTYGAGVCLALLIALFSHGSGSKTQPLWMFLPFVVFLIVGMCFLWSGTNEQVAGTWQYLLGVGGWIVGGFVGRKLVVGQGGTAGAFTTVIFCAIVIQFALSVLQWVGVLAPSVDAQTAELVGGRVSGSLNHPNNLGKTLFLLMALLLPFTKSDNRRIRLTSQAGLIVALIPLGLTGGRAVLAGAILLMGAWAVLQPAALDRGRRFVLPAMAGLAVLMFGGAALSRLEEDPTGGSRDRLLAVALDLIPSHLWTGVGPNSYVTAVGPYDALTATGWPVHNTFVLGVVELGLIGAVLLFVPVVWAALRAVVHLGQKGPHAAFSAAAISSIPGLLLIGTTGWGMLAGPILPLWFFAMAVLTSAASENGLRAGRANGQQAFEREPGLTFLAQATKQTSMKGK
ncbi:O-antigen ligase [Cryobacterium sp. PAMC25264]|uniref:O-antigen ligase family protein n=1 Tax=Cryobacterium sp. PAMC25264 TaxID=2861288 RepID=UPI001C63B0E9|nr:O-antigen ligase family protein [Cryobacterium sp. PAMC25264]QYF73736.1 O-antigen ligase family protein [Cryobacterium sp. PAMC25264]